MFVDCGFGYLCLYHKVIQDVRRNSVATAYHWCQETVKENPKCLSPLESVTYTEGTLCMKVLASDIVRNTYAYEFTHKPL